MPNFNLYQLTQLTCLTNTIITRLIKYIVDIVGNTAEGIINIDYKVIIKVFIEVYFKIIVRRNIIFIRNQIISQLGILQTDKRRYIINFARVYSMLEIGRLLQPIFKASWFNIKGKKILKAKLIRLNSSLQIQKLKINNFNNYPNQYLIELNEVNSI